MLQVCFVCLGNICRSPTAEAIFRALVAEAGLERSIAIDSCGTSAYHIGAQPDSRSRAAGKRRGVTLDGRARQVQREDFHRFDYLVAMDTSNLADLRAVAPADARAQLCLLRSFEASAPSLDVPDPYSGDSAGFDAVFEICRVGCMGLLNHVRGQLPGVERTPK